MQSLLELQNVSKSYRRGKETVPVLENLSLSLFPGEFLSITGPSGSGKSTLMNLLGCLDLPDSGRCLLSGRDLSLCSETELSRIRNREIGFIFQGFHLIPTLTAYENVELPLLYRRLPRRTRQQLCIVALEQMGLSHRAAHRPSELSGGQQQRVAIARAIAASPSLILADEPTGNLDAVSGKAVMDALLSLNQQGKTLVLITHDPTLAKIAPRRLVITDGHALELPQNAPF